ncbi:MAG: hypothetical protein FD174_2658 [Geobacteraceae bacterium]|nr:MAG: hypothetical protein FD174_2658 [Geobacteraceae bacterium]
MTTYNPMRQLPQPAGYMKGDVLVLCGELFGRGYANGIVDEARKKGMTIIGTTIGRRDGDGLLRSLNASELVEAEANLRGKIINIPLEAGFDMEPGKDGRSPLDQLKGVKPDDWETVQLNWEGIEQSRQAGVRRFTSSLGLFAAELEKMVPAGANVLFVHAMAGGIPRARVYMPLLNRIFKGQGERYLSSESFWNSELGRLCKISFDEVTADTFTHLVEATAAVRERFAAAGGKVAYAAYGYHGCEVLINGAYTWQSYIPYLPGWAKIRLEEAAAAACSRGIAAAVFNSPEIQTNSSALFLGVEISLYPLLAALEKEGGGAAAEEIKEECRRLLPDNESIDSLLAEANAYLAAPLLAPFREYATWPHHNSLEQMELMLTSSARLLEMNRNPKEIVCAALSRAVFTAVGKLMFDTMWEPTAPVFWLNHDIIAKRLIAG